MATTINTLAQLQAMENDLTADYELGGNINASATSTWNEDPENPGTYFGFDPIGDSGTPFTGSFDGKGYKIRNLYINRPSEGYIGLFGFTGNGCGEIKNVSIVGCNITAGTAVAALIGFQDDVGSETSSCHSSGTITGTSSSLTVAYVAGLIGYASASVTNCDSTCTLTATSTNARRSVSSCGGLIGSLTTPATISRCYSKGSLTATGAEDVDLMGGFIGYAGDCTITKCYQTGAVTITADVDTDYIGGFIGYSYCDIDNSYARGAVAVTDGGDSTGDIGGFAGIVLSGTLDDCYSTGLITAVDIPNVGGFCGDNYGTITNCFWDKQTSGTIISDGGTGKTTTEMKTESTFTDVGWDFTDIWHITTELNNGYPALLFTSMGFVWVEGNYLHFRSEYGEQKLLGTVTGDTGVAGHIFVEGGYFHYIDESGNERRQAGKLSGGSGGAGYFWTDDIWLYCTSSTGYVRRLGTWTLGQSKLGIDTVLHS